MQVCFISSDEKLCDFVREVVGSEFLSLGARQADAGLCVIDFQPDSGLAAFSEPYSSNRLFLVDPKHLSAFSQQVQGKPVCMLLKPVTRPALEAFLDDWWQERGAKSDREKAEAFRADRDELLQHLLQANLRLQQYDQERTNFLARALHDLRTPLTSLRGVCGLLLEGEVGSLNPQQRELLQRMQNSAGRLARLSTGMFELSVQGRVQRTLQFEPGNVEACVQQALQEVCALVQEKQLNIVSSLAPPQKTIFIEAHHVEQIVINLLENACRFTPRSGKIDILGYPVYWDFDDSPPDISPEFPNAYRIDIRDSGPGIAPAMLETIFEQYTSLAGANDRSGGGLGLAICKAAVSAHSGRIWATSSHEGATFSFVLPFDPRIAASRLRRLSEEGMPRSAQAV